MEKFADRIRFNWGYHDAASDVAYGSKPMWAGKVHPDAVYAAGYAAGKKAAEAGESTWDSTKAWIEYGGKD